MGPRFLTLTEVEAIHRDQVTLYGGSHGTRDLGLLQSAIAMPEASFEGQHLHSGLCEMAAAYLFHIARNHPFVDGNKRVAAVAADVFLLLNGLRLEATQDEYAELVLAVARGEMAKPLIAEFFREKTVSS